MKENRKQRLMDLGAEVLADALLELAGQVDAADDLVERIIASPKENIHRFTAKLAAFKRSRRFVSWGESAGFARDLATLLHDLRAGVEDPQKGAELVAAFYETDKGVFDHCDDSSGHVGDVYRYNAKELFVGYAQRCPDKEWLADLVYKLNRDDGYGVRDRLIDCAAEYLPEENIRALINRIQNAADKEKDKYGKRHWLHLIETLARQIGDAQLFAEARLASWGKLSASACMDIAQVYLESGDVQAALSWVKKIPQDETYEADKRDRLLFAIHDRLGETEKRAEVAWRIFRRRRSKDSLEELLAVIGEEHREAATTGEVESILDDSRLTFSDVTFLLELERLDQTENYLLDRADQLNGDFYGSLIPLAETFENADRHLAASVVYRPLLDSILRHGRTKAYPHGVRYLQKLDRLARHVSDWRGQLNHDAYLLQLRQSHGRKTSFWSQYGK